MSTSANPVTLPLVQYSPKHFLLSAADGVATVTLNRPERKNPLTFESYRELTDFFRACALDDAVKTIVVTGAGGNFSSGGDVFEIIGPLVKMDTKGLTAFTRMTGDLVKAMRACPQPIIAAVEGICAGAGAIIAMASDMRLAATGAKVAFLFNKVGLAGCDMGACAILPRIIGQSRASELLYTGRFMAAEEGERWGFFSRSLRRSRCCHRRNISRERLQRGQPSPIP
jgi:enoyl-CoA hydratase/carnithine racemase